MKILIIDNYDSFTFNLYQYVGELLVWNGSTLPAGRQEPFPTVDVYRNDEITVKGIQKRKYDRIILSPGPGDPTDKKYFGVCADVISELGKTIPILGVCLGMQGIAHVFGGKIVRAKQPMHGKTSVINHDAKGVFISLPQQLSVMRYHSLIVEKASLPECLEISASVFEPHPNPLLTGEGIFGEIMGIRHKTLPIEGIQFHPESFATEGGKELLGNFLFERRSK